MKKVIALEPGLMTTIQDDGRIGYQNSGIPISGSMDYESMCIANALVGKKINSPVLECTLLGPKLKFQDDMFISITGADMQPMINGLYIRMNQTISIIQGDILSFEGLKNGLRTYIAFSDNMICDNVYGSYSTYVKSGFGGYEGRKIKTNDILEFEPIKFCGSFLFEPLNEDKNIIRVMLSYEVDEFEKASVDEFFCSEYKLTNDSDRMGMRFEGLPLKHLNSADIISSPIIPGTIQVPSSGQPTVMMKDAQTIGGYARLGCVISRDLDKLAQLKQGDVISFKLVSFDEAKEIKNDWLNHYENTVKKMEQHTSDGRLFRITINQKLYDVRVEEK